VELLVPQPHLRDPVEYRRRNNSELYPQFEPDEVAFECLLRVDLRQPCQYDCKTGFAELPGVREYRPDTRCHFLEATQVRAPATVTGSLPQIKRLCANPNEAWA
jgi:hypothetical protein